MSRLFRLAAPAALLCAAGAWAQQPPKLEPLPEVPPPPPGMELDTEQVPQVTITRKGEDTVEEYRVNGQLYMLKVTPPNGPAYYLYDERGEGNFARRDALDSGVRVPRWVVKKW